MSLSERHMWKFVLLFLAFAAGCNVFPEFDDFWFCEDPRFTGPDCDACSERFAGPDCRECADPRLEPPYCVECAPSFTGPNCEQCADPRRTGPECEECVDQFEGPDCSVCSDSRVTGENCDECVDTRFGPPDCETTCGPNFTGPGCTQCRDPGLTGENCDTYVFQSVAAGRRTACGVTQGGRIVCWGDVGNLCRQGAGGYPPQMTFSPPEASAYTEIVGGHWRPGFCAISTDQRLACFGCDPCMVGHSSCGTRVPTGEVVAIDCGGEDSESDSLDPDKADCIVILEDGRLQGIGDGPASQSTPTSKFSDIGVGGNHACGVLAENVESQNIPRKHVLCWPTTTVGDHFGQATPPSGPFLAVEAGNTSTCGIKSDGTIDCWPDLVRPPAGVFTKISAGPNFYCAIRDDEAVVCWGEDNFGETDPPVGDFIDVSAGYDFACGILTSGEVKCWGNNAAGQLDVASTR